MKEFREEQRFRQIWIWVTLMFPMVIVPLEIIYAFYKDIEINNGDWAAFISQFVIFTVLIIWFKRMVLITEVSSEGISINYKGLFTKKFFSKTDMAKVEVQTYKPLWHYGGWGLRYSSKRGWCYNVRGDKGIKITFKDGKVVLIGTQMPEDFDNALKQMEYPL